MYKLLPRFDRSGNLLNAVCINSGDPYYVPSGIRIRDFIYIHRACGPIYRKIVCVNLFSMENSIVPLQNKHDIPIVGFNCSWLWQEQAATGPPTSINPAKNALSHTLQLFCRQFDSIYREIKSSGTIVLNIYATVCIRGEHPSCTERPPPLVRLVEKSDIPSC